MENEDHAGTTGLAALAQRGRRCSMWLTIPYDKEGVELDGETFLAFLAKLGHYPVLSDVELAHILDDSDGRFDQRDLGVEADAILFALMSIRAESENLSGGVLRRNDYSRDEEQRKRRNAVMTLAALYKNLWFKRKE